MPVGPNAGKATGVKLVNVAPTVDAAATTKGWVYNYASGEIIANTNDPDEAGVTYDTY